ncbi:hypothetical protein [Aquimarina sp. AU474]|uniref:hypothetical protein n=1 Tax=Aquimarina sp. AU474 TaxID=2108529 RepID=UPI001358172C|nr:hypothetical protein [Aquimarina sp. AU474]
MKSKKKLSLKKMNVAQLDSVKGGSYTGPIFTVLCGLDTRGTICQYSRTPMSCQVCVEK